MQVDGWMPGMVGLTSGKGSLYSYLDFDGNGTVPSLHWKKVTSQKDAVLLTANEYFNNFILCFYLQIPTLYPTQLAVHLTALHPPCFSPSMPGLRQIGLTPLHERIPLPSLVIGFGVGM